MSVKAPIRETLPDGRVIIGRPNGYTIFPANADETDLLNATVNQVDEGCVDPFTNLQRAKLRAKVA